MGKQSTPMVRDSYEAEFRTMRNELESAKQVTANALIEYSRIRDINADLLDALEAIMSDYEAWQIGDIENPMAIVNEEKAKAAIARARGQ